MGLNPSGEYALLLSPGKYKLRVKGNPEQMVCTALRWKKFPVSKNYSCVELVVHMPHSHSNHMSVSGRPIFNVHALWFLTGLPCFACRISKSLTLFSGGFLEWEKWPEMIANWTRSLMLLLDDEDGECPAEEVIKFQEKNGHFGMSTAPRTPRPKHVKFKVGQVIRHKLWNYRGVIIGWDEKLKACLVVYSFL